jgi:hypothetical protein
MVLTAIAEPSIALPRTHRASDPESDPAPLHRDSRPRQPRGYPSITSTLRPSCVPYIFHAPTTPTHTHTPTHSLGCNAPVTSDRPSKANAQDSPPCPAQRSLRLR